MIAFLTLSGGGLAGQTNLGDLSFLPTDAPLAKEGMEIMDLEDGDVFELEAKIVKQSVGNRH